MFIYYVEYLPDHKNDVEWYKKAGIFIFNLLRLSPTPINLRNMTILKCKKRYSFCENIQKG